MTAPQAAMRIAIAAITPSPTNPRKRFDQAALDELAANIKEVDVLQPILLRPNGGKDKYELVAGERRFRAAKAAGLTDIPATIRELTDAQVVEIQIAENMHRKDLHELEEAGSFESLLKCTHDDGTKYTVEDLIRKTGRSRTYIFGRMKLLTLCPEVRKVFYAGEIDGSKALLVARIGHHDSQRQALKDIQHDYGRGPMSYREAHQHILRTYMLQLKEAPFDIKDGKLVAKAGACGPCPKRTGNQADLFGDVKSADVCTDPKCFDDKRQAHYHVAVRELEAAGNKVIAGAAAKKLFLRWDDANQYSRDHLQGGYLRLSDSTYASGPNRKVSEILGAEFKPTLIQHPGTGEIVKAATQQAITAAASKAARQGKKKGGKQRAAAMPRERESTKEEIFNERLFLELAKKLPEQLGKVELADIARDMLTSGGGDVGAAALLPATNDTKKRGQYYGYNNKRFEAEIAKQDVAGLSRLVYGLLLAREAEDNYGRPKLLLAVAKRWKVDPEKVKRAIADEAKAAEASAKVAKKPAKKAKPVKTFRHPASSSPSIIPVITPLIKPMGMDQVDAVLKKRAKPAAKAKKTPARKLRPLAQFMKPMKPSAALAVIVGDKPMPRTEITSKLWGYIKKKNLQDKTNRRMINVDDALRPIMGNKKQVSMFEMTKFVAKHLS